MSQKTKITEKKKKTGPKTSTKSQKIQMNKVIPDGQKWHSN